MTSCRIHGQPFGRLRPGDPGASDWDHPDHWAHRGRDRLVACNRKVVAGRPPTGEEMKQNPSVRRYLLAALKASYDAKGKAEGEHGGWIYSSPEFPATFCFRLTEKRYPRAATSCLLDWGGGRGFPGRAFR